MTDEFRKNLCQKALVPLHNPPFPPRSKSSFRSVIEEPEALDDPRVKRKPQHKLINIVTIALLAILCGSDSMVAIETKGQMQKGLVRDVFSVTQRDTFSRYFFESFVFDRPAAQVLLSLGQ